MILINLLPHREAARKRRKEVFQIAMFAALLVGLLISAGIYAWFQWLIETQQARNAFLQSEITVLNRQIKDVEGLEGEIAALRARQTAVEDLQSDRNMPVHLLSDLTQLLPEGVYLTSLKQNGLSVELKGAAQSNERVSEVLRNLSSSSPWITQPVLKEIVSGSVEVAPKDLRKVVNFSMTFTLVRSAQVAQKQNTEQRKP
ncbi:MAG: PilN domain-containing protein [Comamonas sp.]|nr:PilN domain-containing protein [Comamonas sp.]